MINGTVVPTEAVIARAGEGTRRPPRYLGEARGRDQEGSRVSRRITPDAAKTEKSGVLGRSTLQRRARTNPRRFRVEVEGIVKLSLAQDVG